MYCYDTDGDSLELIIAEYSEVDAHEIETEDVTKADVGPTSFQEQLAAVA